jgi:hypothetical protein
MSLSNTFNLPIGIDAGETPLPGCNVSNGRLVGRIAIWAGRALHPWETTNPISALRSRERGHKRCRCRSLPGSRLGSETSYSKNREGTHEYERGDATPPGGEYPRRFSTTSCRRFTIVCSRPRMSTSTRHRRKSLPKGRWPISGIRPPQTILGKVCFENAARQLNVVL